jgi:predicted nucleotidyltransferase
MRYGLSDSTINKINAVFALFPEVNKVILYGSRAKGNYKPGSDIDLSMFGEGLTSILCSTITDKLDELLLPYMIDLSVFAELNHPELEAHIARVGVVFYERDDEILRNPLVSQPTKGGAAAKNVK